MNQFVYLLVLRLSVVYGTTPIMGKDNSIHLSSKRFYRYQPAVQNTFLSDTPVSRDDASSRSSVIRDVKKFSRAMRRLPKKRSKMGEETRFSATSIRKLMLDVIAERDSQLFDTLIDMNRTEIHLKSIVEMIEESNQISQNIASIMVKLDEGIRRLDSKMIVMGEKLLHVEARQLQLDRRIEREAASIANRIEEVLKKSNRVDGDLNSDRVLLDIRELLSDLSLSIDKISSQGTIGNDIDNAIMPVSTAGDRHSLEASLETRLISIIQAVHGDIVKIVREVENNVDNQLAMVTGDTAYIHCGIGKLLEQNTSLKSVNNNDVSSAEDFDCSTIANGNTDQFCP
ncbi:uncharacterized protein LOC136032738 [Artemia franciscana]|uniref:Uncharacterized protein n=1 Tax=Artemia franciscana TaxID=6661 RepID=A0AA88I8T2_ARTSF|nr:hypothetical protein QYM36_001240 [Artemia franciscana]KAK2724674.1 hypothetical protein QYM36_001240 [Artemia franciscana]KAK2724675.1 hypothetical protein QYM36_001240 [Artemia franciscana]